MLTTENIRIKRLIDLDPIEQVEGKCVRIMREHKEQYALTDATHSRSTSRLKTQAELAKEDGEIHAYCEALCRFTNERTSTEVFLRLKELAE